MTCTLLMVMLDWPFHAVTSLPLCFHRSSVDGPLYNCAIVNVTSSPALVVKVGDAGDTSPLFEHVQLGIIM